MQKLRSKVYISADAKQLEKTELNNNQQKFKF